MNSSSRPDSSIEWGGSGAQSVGAERFSTYTPTIYFGKGMGDLPVDLMRPFAVTGVLGYALPGNTATRSVTGTDPDTGEQLVDTEFHPRILVWGGSLQYSMPYLKSAVVDLALPDVVDHLIPIVEASLQSPVSNTFMSGRATTGTIDPGVIWAGRYMQFGVEAMIPINRDSGSNVGVIGQLHFYLDDIAPATLGRPLFAATTSPGRPMFGQ